MVRGILLFLGVLFFSSISYSEDNQRIARNHPQSREFRYDVEFGSRRPQVLENWDGGEGHMRVSLIESADDLALASARKLLQEFSPRQQILYLNLDHKPETPSDLEEMILEDERVQRLPDEMGRGLREELQQYKSERSGLIKKHSRHIAAIHFASSLGAFTLVSYLGADLPHIAHVMVGLAAAWECWLSQRYLIQINRFLYNITDNFFKGTEYFLHSIGLKNQMSRFAVDLEKNLNDAHPHVSFPKKLMVSFFTFILYCGEWALFEMQHSWIKDFFGAGMANGDALLKSITQFGTWGLWSFVLQASLLDLFSEGIPHWAVNNYSRNSKLKHVEQAHFIYKWSSAISLFVTFTTLGALATDIAVFKWVSFPVAAAGAAYFIFDGVIRNRDSRNKITMMLPERAKVVESQRPPPRGKKISCLIRLSTN